MKKYFSFTEEANRSEYWAINLLTWAGSWILMILALIIAGMFTFINSILGGLLAIIGVFGVLAIGIYLILAVAARRCNEANISRWWILPLLIPVIGFIMTIVLGVIPPDPDRIKIKINV